MTVVEQHFNPFGFAIGGIAGVGAEDGVEHASVGVEDNANRIASGGGGNVGGLGQALGARQVSDPLTSSFRLPPATMFTPAVGTRLQRAAGCLHHRRRLLIGHRGLSGP